MPVTRPWTKALKMKPEEVIEEVKVSGLAGAAGRLPTWFKWDAARKAEGRNIICNADRGDPGAFMDRAVIESDPHTLIEGMLIAPMPLGPATCMYISGRSTLWRWAAGQAIEQARNAACWGKNILGTDFSCDLNIKIGAGAFVCGEGTLIESMEGKRGMPG